MQHRRVIPMRKPRLRVSPLAGSMLQISCWNRKSEINPGLEGLGSHNEQRVCSRTEQIVRLKSGKNAVHRRYERAVEEEGTRIAGARRRARTDSCRRRRLSA